MDKKGKGFTLDDESRKRIDSIYNKVFGFRIGAKVKIIKVDGTGVPEDELGKIGRIIDGQRDKWKVSTSSLKKGRGWLLGENELELV